MKSANTPHLVHLSDGTVDLRHDLVHRGGQTTSLTTKESDLLGFLATRSDEPIDRDTLHREVWGYSDSVVSRAVDTTVRRLRMKIEGDPSKPMHLITVHGLGYRWVRAHAQPSRQPSTVAHTLEVEPDSFFGREADLRRLGDCLADGARIVSVVGPPGTGKTRLVRRYGATQLSRLSGQVWCCDLSGARSAQDVGAAVACALGAPLSGVETEERVAELLAERGSLLLILDNFEGVVADAHKTVGRWHIKAPRARFLVTTRERLREPGEFVVEIGPLDRPAAIALFQDRARAVSRAFSADAVLLGQIVDRLECLPLAIELAAARANLMSPAALFDRLVSPLKVLGRGPRGAAERGSSLRGALDASWELLERWERSALAQCSVFCGGFTVDAVESVIDLSGEEQAPWVVDVVQALREKSLIQVYAPDDFPGDMRFRLYTSVRDYATERLEDKTAHLRHGVFYLNLGERLVSALDGPEASASLQRLELERDNLLAVHRAAIHRAPEDALRAVIVLDPLLSAHGPMETQRSLLDEAVALSGAVDTALRGQVLRLRGEARRVRGHMDGARVDLEEALSIGEDLGREDIESFALASLSFLHWSAGRLDEARAMADRSLRLHRSRSDRVHESLMRMTIGIIEKREGDWVSAEAHYREALAVQQTEGIVRYEGLTLLNLANLMRARGQLDEAEKLYEQSGAAFQRFGHLRWQASALHNRAALCALRGDLELAESVAREALAAARRGGEALTVVHVLHCLGHILHLQGRFEGAERAYVGAMTRLEGIDPVLHASSRGDLGALQADQGRIDLAERTLALAKTELAEGGPEIHQVLSIHCGHLDAARARAACAAGYGSEADQHLAEARRRLSEVEGTSSESWARPQMAMRLLHRVLERS